MASQVQTGRNRNSPPRKLQPRHVDIVQKHCAGRGQKEIADELGVSRQTIRRVLEHDDAKRMIAQHREEAEHRLQNLAGKAVDRLEALLDSEDERVQLDAISKLCQLSRRGEGEGASVTVNVNQVDARERLASAIRNTVDLTEYSELDSDSA